MLSILVCHSYFMRFDPKQRQRARPYPPLATLQVAGLLRAAGHAVSLFDAMLARGVDDFVCQLPVRRPQLVLLYEDNYNFLSKMCLTRMREAACEMIAAAQRSGAFVIVAGSDVSDAPDCYLRAGANVCLLGEGIGTLLEVIRRLQAAPGSVTARLTEGLSDAVTLGAEQHPTNGVHAIGATQERPLHGAPLRGERPSAHPIPGSQAGRIANAVDAAGNHTEQAAWDLIDIESYRRVWRQAHGYFSINMAASRGCPFRCSWCAKPIWGNQYLQRGAAAVAAEMTILKRRFQPDHVWFADDIFGFRPEWVEAFAQHLRSAQGGVPFTIQIRADLVSERMALALRAAGCREAWIGAESGSQKILDSMHKGATTEQILTARARLGKAGIRVGFFIQLGYLGEELPDILATRELVAAARPDDIGVSVSYPLPGTRFHELVREQLQGKTHWSDSADLAMMFQGTYTSEFYRQIRDLLHEQVRLQRTPPHRGARLALQGRWQHLLEGECSYRSAGNPVAAVV